MQNLNMNDLSVVIWEKEIPWIHQSPFLDKEFFEYFRGFPGKLRQFAVIKNGQPIGALVLREAARGPFKKVVVYVFTYYNGIVVPDPCYQDIVEKTMIQYLKNEYDYFEFWTTVGRSDITGFLEMGLQAKLQYTSHVHVKQFEQEMTRDLRRILRNKDLKNLRMEIDKSYWNLLVDKDFSYLYCPHVFPYTEPIRQHSNIQMFVLFLDDRPVAYIVPYEASSNKFLANLLNFDQQQNIGVTYFIPFSHSRGHINDVFFQPHVKPEILFLIFPEKLFPI